MKFSYNDNYKFWNSLLFFPNKNSIYGCNIKELAKKLKKCEGPK